MKKLLLSIVACFMAISMSAQSGSTPFTKGKMYANANFSGFDLGYNGTSKWNVVLSGKAGYLVKNNLMVLGELGWGIYQKAPNDFSLGAGARYYIEQNGIYLGAGARYRHSANYNDFMPNVNVGYTFFLTRSVTVEPELYFDFSTKSFSDYTGFGLRIGFGVYL